MLWVVLGIGLLTFFSPLIRTDTAVLGRTQWSPLQIAIELHKGSLPIQPFPVERKVVMLNLTVEGLMGCAIIYFVLLLTFAATLLLPRSELVLSLAGLGIAIMWGEAQFDFSDLQEILYGAPSSFADGHQVHAASLALILLGIFLLSAWIAMTKQLEY